MSLDICKKMIKKQLDTFPELSEIIVSEYVVRDNDTGKYIDTITIKTILKHQ